MNKLCVILNVLVCIATGVNAQTMESPNSYETRLSDEMKNLWQHTMNPAGMARDSVSERGMAYADFNHNEGTHYLVQNGDRNNNLSFYADAFKRLSKYVLGYGSVSFGMGRMFNRGWSDVIRTYHSDPYVSGSSVTGSYDRQDVELTAAISSVDFNGLTYGFRLDYSVGDLSRLRDPRSRVNLAEYRITPAVTYKKSDVVMGVSAHYKRRKEKLDSYKVVNTDADYVFYTFTGLENATSVTGGYTGYQREYVDHELGAELTFSFSHGGSRSLSSLTYNKAVEDIFGIYKYMPGKYSRKEVAFQTCNVFSQSNGVSHKIDFRFAFRPSYGDEYRQSMKYETDAQTGITSRWWETTLETKKRYEMTDYVADLHYRMAWTMDGKVKSYAGAHLGYNYNREEYHLPESSLEVAGVDVLVEGGTSLFSKKQRALWVEGVFGYHVSAKSNLQLNDETTDYAVNVLVPDMTFWSASFLQGKASVSYQFPMTIKDVCREYFVKAYGHVISTDKDTNAFGGGVSFGVFY